MDISIHKFGGASVKNADAVRNVANILKSLPPGNQFIIVVSAMERLRINLRMFGLKKTRLKRVG